MKERIITRVDGRDVEIIVKTKSSSTFYRVYNSTEQEALNLFEKNSHLVRFIGRLDLVF